MRRTIAALAAAAFTLSACATFQAAPTASSCAKAQGQFADAQTTVVIAQAALVAAQQAGAKPATIARLQNDLNAAASIVQTAAQVTQAKCAVAATPSQPPAAAQP